VDVAVAGHDHIYERFGRLNTGGNADPRGMRHFVVGTGGAALYKIGAIKLHSEVRDTTSHGVIKFTLHPSRYQWEFVAVAGRPFSDRGSALCHDKPNRSK